MILTTLDGLLFNYINRHLIMTALLFVISAGLATAPHFYSVYLLYGFALVMGFCGGGFDTGQVVWIIEMWGHDSGPYLQGFQLFNGIGILACSLIMRPFLSDEALNIPTSKAEGATFDWDNSTLAPNLVSTQSPPGSLLTTVLTSTPNSTVLPPTVAPGRESRIEIPFSIGSGLALLGAIILLILLIYKRYQPPEDVPTEEASMRPGGSKKFKVLLIFLGALMISAYVGLEVVNMQYVSSFGYFCKWRFSPQEGANLFTSLGGAFVVGRAISTFVSTRVEPETILYFNYGLVVVAEVILLFYAHQVALLWTGFVLLGAGFSAVFSAVYAFLEKHIEIGNAIGAIFVSSSGVMAAITPTLVGQYIEDTPEVLIYVSLGCLTLSISAFAILSTVLSWSVRQSSRRSKELVRVVRPS